ncbi:hypothetical protein K469DRAFT_691857 [Zopfia rhizophila CBS 207.26]|uniref:Uncharacterized protein n=1 Tax=Zopfia rhizophila CBS 207.26 TaxID=1314779 RepID=A0A6A6DTS5_9PEZI|nr:hypothetical protein K469DRAFT_691857 [Zopfia rhizophila CBS 207.26]
MGTPRQLKALVNRQSGRYGTLRIIGHALAIPSVESRHDTFKRASLTPWPMEGIPIAPNFSLRALIEEVQMGDPTTPTRPEPNPQVSPIPRPRSPSPELDEYDPTRPMMPPNSLLSKIRVAEARRYNPETTELFQNNPHILHHIAAGAPYTANSCSRCTATRRCRNHREMLELSTSVSLCQHKRMVLFWRVNDPSNRKCSWKLEIKDYTTYDVVFEMECDAICMPYQLSKRVELLAERVVEDFRKEKERCNRRVVEDEIRGLLASYEYGLSKRKERIEEAMMREEIEGKKMEKEKRLREEMQREMQEKLEEVIRVVKEDMEAGKAQQKKRKASEIEDGEIVAVSKKVCVESPAPAIDQQEHELTGAEDCEVVEPNEEVRVGSPPYFPSKKGEEDGECSEASETDTEGTASPSNSIASSRETLATEPFTLVTATPESATEREDEDEEQGEACESDAETTASPFGLIPTTPTEKSPPTTPPSIIITPPLAASHKRKRSSSFSSPTPKPPAKKVRFTDEVKRFQL